MPRDSRLHHARIKSTHITIAAGAAKRKPRAKPDRRVGQAWPSGSLSGTDVSLVIATLSIIATDLLHLRHGFYQRIGKSEGRQRKVNDGYAGKAEGFCLREPSRLKWFVRLRREIADLALIIRAIGGWETGMTLSASQQIIILAKGKRGSPRSVMLRIAVFFVLCFSGPRMANAEPAEVLTPIEMFDPERANGVRVSPGIILFPEATADIVYDSNIFNLDAVETEDAYLSVRPALIASSDFSRHAVRIEGRAELRRYFDSADENSDQWDLRATGLLDLGQGIDVEAFGGVRRGIESRGTLGDVFLTDEPVAFIEKQAGIEISRSQRLLELSGTAGILRRDYSDTSVNGVSVDLSQRDVTIRTASVRADFRLTERTRIFAELSGNQIDFENPSTPALDSKGYSVLAGVSYELTSLVSLEAAGGYIYQDFENPLVDSATGVNYRLTATWTPRPEWRFTGSAARTVDASRTQESPAIIINDVRLGAERAIGDRTLVRVEAAYMEDDYRGTPRLDKRFVAAVSTAFRFSEQISLLARASYRDQDGGAFGRSFEGFSASVGMRAVW